MLASCGADIKYLDWPSCRIINAYKNAGSIHSSYFRCISWSGSGNKLATVPDGHFPIVIDPNEFEDYTGMKYYEIQVPRVNSLAFSKRYENMLALGCETGHLFQYDISEKTIHIIATLPKSIYCVKYGIADETLAASCKGGQIYLFNGHEKLMSTYYVPDSWSVSAIALHPNERNVLCGASREGIVAVWDCSTGHLKFRAHDHQSEITGLAFSRCDWLFASTSADYSLNLYDLRIKEKIFNKMFNQKLSAVEFPVKGNYFVVGSQHGKVMTFDKRKLSVPKSILQTHEGAVRQFAFQNENKYDEHVVENVKICQSELSLKNDPQEIMEDIPTNVENKVGSGDTGDIIELANIPVYDESKASRTVSQLGSWLVQDSENSGVHQSLLGAQEEICKCTEETLRAFIREMHDKFLLLWMSINKDLASLENRTEMRWKKFHSMIFDLGQETIGDCGITSIGSQTGTHENTTTDIFCENPKSIVSNSVPDTAGKQKNRSFKIF